MLSQRLPSTLAILVLLTLSACNLPALGGATPTTMLPLSETSAVDLAPSVETAAPTLPPAATEAAVVATPPAATAAVPTALLTEAPSEAYPAPATQAAEPAASQPTATQAAPAVTSAPFDPYTTYGKPKYQNKMEVANLGEWAQAETKKLPNNSRIRLRFKDGQLYVTGKRLGFSTWWFSYHTLSDAYIEMTFNTEDCSGEDAYGIIFRGPPHLAGISYGYVVSFTCNGKLWVYRLDDADPFDTEVLIDETQTSAIHRGSDEENVIGVRAEGERFVIFANGVQVGEVEDDHFAKGRVGVFVRAARPGVYTYRVTNFAYWILGEDE